MNDSKQLIGGGLIAIALFLFWVFPYAEYTKISALKDAITERDGLIKERSEIQDQVKKLSAEHNRQSNEIKVLQAVVPSEKETAEIISALQVIGQQNGVQLLGVSFSESTDDKDKPYNTMRLTMNGSGGYSAIRGMLNSIEQNIRLIDVKSLKMGVDQQTRQLLFDIQAEAYFLK
jgi:Tfp pilus assembly protein PilO